MHSVYTRKDMLKNRPEYRAQSTCTDTKNTPLASFNPSKISQLHRRKHTTCEVCVTNGMQLLFMSMVS